MISVLKTKIKHLGVLTWNLQSTISTVIHAEERTQDAQKPTQTQTQTQLSCTTLQKGNGSPTMKFLPKNMIHKTKYDSRGTFCSNERAETHIFTR